MKVVVTSPDVVGPNMAGPGIRALHLARELSTSFETTLVARIESGSDLGISSEQWGSAAARALKHEADVVVGQPTREMLSLRRAGQRRVFDLFDPVILELDELYRSGASVRQRAHRHLEQVRLHRALTSGDLLIAATRRQLDFYCGFHRALGGAAAARTANPDRWVIVPFGCEEAPNGAAPDQPPMLLWGGGAWKWLDPELAIAAADELNRQGVGCVLQFLGGARPNDAADAARIALRDDSPHVRVHREWVPYSERWRWLHRAKVAMMLHRRTVEAEYSVRTRLFDAIAAEVPVITTAGGFAAELVEQEKIGLVVAPSDLSSVVSGIRKLLTDDVFHAASVSNMRRLQPRFSWSAVTKPLIEAIRQWDR